MIPLDILKISKKEVVDTISMRHRLVPMYYHMPDHHLEMRYQRSSIKSITNMDNDFICRMKVTFSWKKKTESEVSQDFYNEKKKMKIAQVTSSIEAAHAKVIEMTHEYLFHAPLAFLILLNDNHSPSVCWTMITILKEEGIDLIGDDDNVKLGLDEEENTHEKKKMGCLS